MNQQNQASGSLSSVPMKRKRGRPRKEESAAAAQRENNTPVMSGGSNNVLNSNQAAGDPEDEMVGKVVTGVIEASFSAGYLLNVKVEDSDAYLRGLVFLPGQVAPITPENDVAPHVKMIQRKEISIPVPVPVPVLNPQTAIHCSKQPSEPELQPQVPNSGEQVLPPPTEIHFAAASVPLENQSAASTMFPMADLPKNETSVFRRGIPLGILEPVHENNQSGPVMSELVCDKTVSREEALREFNASTQVTELSADNGGAIKDSEPASELINLVPPTMDNTDNNELIIAQQVVPSVHKLNESIHDETNASNIELNQVPAAPAEPESVPSEQVSNKSVDKFVEEQASPKTDVLEDTKTKLIGIETLSKVDPSNGKSGTGVGNNSLDVGPNHALETSQQESMVCEQISKSVPPFQSMFSPEGCAFREKTDPQNYSSFDGVSKVDINKPTGSLVNSMETGKQI